ncbi:MAG: L,D-transpeptidase family protein [Coriobacteriia bacterium]
MSVRTRAIRLVGLLGAMLMLALSAGFAWSVADDYAESRIIPRGVSFQGVELGGLNDTEAHAAVERQVADTWMQSIEVKHGSQVFTLDPQESLSVDTDAIVKAAFEFNSIATVAERSYRRIADKPVTAQIEPVLSVADDSLTGWIESVASQVDSPSVDATITIVEGSIVSTHSATGSATDVDAAAKLITEALLTGKRTVELPVAVVEPGVKDDQLGKTIVVDISQRRLTLYSGMSVEKTYGVAVGTPGYPTPKGSFEITLKRYRPSWSNPAPNGWGKGMPASIPPGPSNPLGTRALNLNYPGIRIHGTNKNSSIGTAASHGCMRMHRWDIEDLYERVEVGTPVLIVR